MEDEKITITDGGEVEVIEPTEEAVDEEAAEE
jgi:hypothetical protein